MNYGIALKQIRESKNLTLQEIAENTGFSISYLTQLENGDKTPSIPTLELICKAMDIPTYLPLFISINPDSYSGNKKRFIKHWYLFFRPCIMI